MLSGTATLKEGLLRTLYTKLGKVLILRAILKDLRQVVAKDLHDDTRVMHVDPKGSTECAASVVST